MSNAKSAEARVVSGLPEPQGLYHPNQEHDACGIWFVAKIKGEKSHGIIEKGIQILINLTHRGACGCDPETGDGAGLLIQIPHKFFAREAAKLGFTLPAAGEYGVGMVFLPVEPNERREAEGILERIIAKKVSPSLAGAIRRSTSTPSDGSRAPHSPISNRFFVGHEESYSQDELERKLYIIRKRAEIEVPAAEGMINRAMFYLPSLSSRTIIYKGLLLAPQIANFYPELSDPELMSALCLVHASAFPQHLPHLATRASLPLHRAQRRNQHRARQRQLDVRAPVDSGIAALR